MEIIMTLTTGYYQGGGQLWKHGEVPACDICGKSADSIDEHGAVRSIRATNTSGVNICFEDECAISHCNSQFEEIEVKDDGKAPCIDCEKPTLPVDDDNELWDGDLVGEFICDRCLSCYEGEE